MGFTHERCKIVNQINDLDKQNYQSSSMGTNLGSIQELETMLKVEIHWTNCTLLLCCLKPFKAQMPLSRK